MPNTPSEDINFIPGSKTSGKENAGISKQLLRWTVSSGKKVIILTQIIVIIAIFISYSLDSDLLAVSNRVQLNQDVVAKNIEFEEEHNNLVQDVDSINHIQDSEIDWEARLNDLNSSIPSNMVLRSFNYGIDSLEIEATVKDAQGFGLYLQTLLTDDEIISIALRSSSYDIEEDRYVFTLLITFQDDE